jgi:Protein of unknown function (DUF3237)
MSGEPASPAMPGLEYVFSIHAEIETPRSAGPGLGGERLHIPIIGGEVRGKRLNGTIISARHRNSMSRMARINGCAKTFSSPRLHPQAVKWSSMFTR